MRNLRTEPMSSTKIQDGLVVITDDTSTMRTVKTISSVMQSKYNKIGRKQSFIGGAQNQTMKIKENALSPADSDF